MKINVIVVIQSMKKKSANTISEIPFVKDGIFSPVHLK